MLEKKFDVAIDFAQKLMKLDELDEKKIKNLIRFTKQFKVNRQLSTLKQVYNSFCKVAENFPDSLYSIQIDFTYTFCDVLVEFGKQYKDHILRHFDGLVINMEAFKSTKATKFTDSHMYAIGMYSMLADQLVHLGITGEAYNALLKTRDPWVTLYDRDKHTGDEYLYNESLFTCIENYYALISEVNRENMIGKYGLIMENLSIMGDINDYSTYYFKRVENFLCLGKDASIYDIKFLISYLKLLVSKKDLNEDFRKIERILFNEFTVHYKNMKYYYCYLISSEFAKIFKTRNWIEIAEDLSEKMNKKEKQIYFKMLLAINNEVKDTNVDKLVFNSLKDILLLGKAKFDSRIQLDLFKKRNSYVFDAAFSYYYMNEKWGFIVESSYLWNCFNNEENEFYINNKNILISVLNNFTDRPLFVLYSRGKSYVLEAQSELELIDILNAKDKLEDSWTALLSEASTREVKKSTRIDKESANKYDLLLSKFINLDKLISLFNNVDNEKIECIEVTWTNTPIVSVINTKIEQTLSIAKSGGSNKRNPIIKNVLIWANPDGSLYRAEQEVDSLKKYLNNKNIDYEIYYGEECTKQEFIKKYKNMKYDVIWMITHGKFNHNNPSQSEIIISHEAVITPEELSNIKIIRDCKRLLILNACQSATAEVRFNSMGFNGIAATLASKNQSVLGHLWPIDSFASAIFGSLLIKFLLINDQADISLALKHSNKIMAEGKEMILEKLADESLNLEIIERIKNDSQDFSTLFYSKSAIVFD